MADAPSTSPAAPTPATASASAVPGTPPGGAPAAAPIPEALAGALKAAGINPDTMEMQLTIDGEVEIVPLAVARNFAQKVRAADKRFQTAAQREKAFDKLAEDIRGNPDKLWEAAKQLGVDADDLALARVEAALKREAELANETPAQRAQREELEKLKADRAAEDRQKAEAARQEKVQAQFQAQGKLLYQAVEKTSLPHTDATALRMVNLMERALEQNIELDPASLAHYAEQEVMEEVRAVLAAQKDIGKRRKLVGEDLLQAILRGDVETITTAPGAPQGEERPAKPQFDPNDDSAGGRATARFKPAKKSKPEAQAIRELTRALKSGNIPRPV